MECAIQGPTARQDADEAERARWIQVLAVTLKATHPSMGQLLSTSTKLFNSQIYHVFHQELLASALPDRPSKQASRFLVAVLVALKPLVVDHDIQYLRMFAWWLLLQAWASLRVTDH